MSSALGKQIEAIWHTSVVVHGSEIFYGGHGISRCAPGSTALKQPMRIIDVGQTGMSEPELVAYLRELSRTLFKGGQYRLFDHNCNTFSDHLIHHLTGSQIPAHILELPSVIQSTPLGGILKDALQAYSQGLPDEPHFIHPNGNNNSSKADDDASDAYSLDNIRREFEAMFFDEPLSSEVARDKIGELWPPLSSSGEESGRKEAIKLATLLFDLVSAKSSSLESQIDSNLFSLLDMTRLTNFTQARFVLDLFRLAIWRSPTFLVALLTDSRELLAKLISQFDPDQFANSHSLSRLETFQLRLTRAELLTNFVGMASDWSSLFADSSVTKIDVGLLVKLCLYLFEHESDSAQLSVVLCDHDSVAMTLAHNLALFDPLTEDQAMELGGHLIHLAVSQGKSAKRPSDISIMLRIIYILSTRFHSIAEYAKCCDLVDSLSTVIEDSVANEEESPQTPATNSCDRPCLLRRQSSSQPSNSYLVARLLDLLYA